MQLDVDTLWTVLFGSSNSPSTAQSGGNARNSMAGQSLSVSAARSNNPAAGGKQVGAGRSNSSPQLCADAAPILFAMLRVLLNQPQQQSAQRLFSESGFGITRLIKTEAAFGSSSRNYPLTIMQFFMVLYQHEANFQIMCLTADFLASLVSVLFPINSPADSPSAIPAPELVPVITFVFRLSTDGETTCILLRVGNNFISNR